MAGLLDSILGNSGTAGLLGSGIGLLNTPEATSILTNLQNYIIPDWAQPKPGQSIGSGMVQAIPLAMNLLGPGRTPKINIADSGLEVRFSPEGMQIPEYGKGLTWGLRAFRGDRQGEPAFYVRDARLPEENQGQGLGVAMYQKASDLAKSEGLPFQSDSTVTQSAANVWMALNRRGYNVQMAPNVKYTPGPPEAPFLGRFETQDGSPVFQIRPPK